MVVLKPVDTATAAKPVPAACGGGLELRWVHDAVQHPPPEPPVLVEGMIRAGELCVVGAPRAIGKSWLAMNLAVLVAEGDGLVMGSLPVRSATRVLYAQGELMRWNSARRWRMLCSNGEPPAGIAETFTPFRLSVRRVVEEVTTPSGGRGREEYFKGVLDPRVEQTVAEGGFGMLILDPWATYFAGNENSNDEVEAALNELRKLALRYSTAIVIFHHLKKLSEGRDLEDQWRGASRLADWASTRVTLLPHYSDKQAEEAGLTPVEARRYVDTWFLRRDEPTEPFSAVLDRETGWWSRWEPSNPEAMTVSSARRQTVSVDDVIAKLASEGAWASRRQALDDLTKTGMPEIDARRALEKATGEGLVQSSRSGNADVLLLTLAGQQRASDVGLSLRCSPEEALAREGFTSEQIRKLLAPSNEEVTQLLDRHGLINGST